MPSDMVTGPTCNYFLKQFYGLPPTTMFCCPAVNTGAYAPCPGAAQYTLAGDKACRNCSTNAIAVPTKDGCMCKDGYVPKSTTSSLDGSLECVTCAAGTYSRAGDQNCTMCPQDAISGAAAGACIKCQTSRLMFGDEFIVAENVANAARTDCVCIIRKPVSGVLCVTQGSGVFARCSCNVTYASCELCFSPSNHAHVLLCVLH
jgi:hypothetical protein